MKKTKVKSKNIVNIFAVIAVVLVFGICGIFAYLTDTDAKVNKFVIGDVKILLHEDNWHPTIDTDNDTIPDAAKIGLGQTVTKDPAVENTGDEPAYIYLKVFVPRGTYDDGLTTVTNGDLFEYTIDNTKWTELPESRSVEDDCNVYVYYYNTELAAPTNNTPSITEPLFEEITLKARPNESREASVKVEAYAIQSTGLPQGTTVLNTEWAEEFKTYATQNPQNTTIENLISLADCSLSTGDAEQIELDPEDNESSTVTITPVKPENDERDIEPYTYTSSKPNVATVDENGLVTAVAPGTTTITLTGTKSGATKTISVKVLGDVLVSLSDLQSASLGDYVDLETDLIDKTIALSNGKTPLTDWRVFSKESNGTWLILSNYLPQSELPNNTGLNLGTSPYCVNSQTSRMDLLNSLNNASVWKELIFDNSSLYNNSNVIVKGAIDVETWKDSWNSNTGYTTLYTPKTSSVMSDGLYGYYVGISSDTNGGYYNVSSDAGYNNTLYFPNNTAISNCAAYWTSSPSAYSITCMMPIHYGGNISYGDVAEAGIGLRPVVFIPNNI